MHFRIITTLDTINDPSVSDWIKVGEESLSVQKDTWNEFVSKNGLSGQDARDRFVRVLKVLVSNEYLVNMPMEEVEVLLRALAIAIQ